MQIFGLPIITNNKHFGVTFMKLKVSLIFILLTSSLVVAQTDNIYYSGFEFISKLNGTGIVWAGEYPLGNNNDCSSTTISSPQDCSSGRDATHNDPSDGHAGFSYTKLDANGSPLDASAISWSCVRDNVTGLVWEVKTTNSNDIHYMGNTYKWGGVTAIGLGNPQALGDYFDDWNSLVHGSNDNEFCGIDSWRVPKYSELSSIINKSTSFPAIDLNYFPNTVRWYWSATPMAPIDHFSWLVSFGIGQSSNDYRNSPLSVRLVSSEEH